MAYSMRFKGFTLIELIVVCMIIVIISSIGYGSYQHQIIKTRRLEAQVALLETVAEIEVQMASLLPDLFTKLTIQDVYSQEITPHGWYRLSLIHGDKNAYTLLATANKKIEELDEDCAVFLLTHALEKKSKNQKGREVNDCWQE